MARKPNDPAPYLLSPSGVEPEVVSRDFNLFYKPDKKPESKALNSLISSLSNIVPKLATYSVTEEVKFKNKSEAEALKDFNENSNAFKDMVKNEEIPAGANPFYYNKMMELELNNKARNFQKQWDEFYLKNDLMNNEDPNAFTQAYEGFIKQYYQDENLENYDALALKKGFFSKTDTFRNQRDQQHFAKRMSIIEGRTEENAVMDFSGTIIDNQDTDQAIPDLLKDLKTKTDNFIDLGYSKSRANELLVKGIESYINTVNDEAGFEYAKELLEGLEDFKLGTGYFAGGEKGKAIKQRLESIIAQKEYDFYDLAKKKKVVTKELSNTKLSEDYWEAYNNTDTFSITEFIDQKTYSDNSDFAEVTGEKYSNEEKAFLTDWHNTVTDAKKIKENNTNALTDLMRIQENDIYSLKDKAYEYLQNGDITYETFEKFWNSTKTYKVLENNLYFNNSLPYKNYMSMFKDKLISQHPALSSELHAMRNNFQAELLSWFNTNKDKYKGRDLQKQLDGEVKSLMGEILGNSMIVQQDYDTFSQIFSTYGIVIPKIGDGS